MWELLRQLTSSLCPGKQKQNRTESKQLGQTPVTQEKSLQDHIAIQYEHQSKEPALLRGAWLQAIWWGKAGEK